MRNISTHTPTHLYASHLHTSSMPHTHTPLCLTPTHLLYASHPHTSSVPHTYTPPLCLTPPTAPLHTNTPQHVHIYTPPHLHTSYTIHLLHTYTPIHTTTLHIYTPPHSAPRTLRHLLKFPAVVTVLADVCGKVCLSQLVSCLMTSLLGDLLTGSEGAMGMTEQMLNEVQLDEEIVQKLIK